MENWGKAFGVIAYFISKSLNVTLKYSLTGCRCPRITPELSQHTESSHLLKRSQRANTPLCVHATLVSRVYDELVTFVQLRDLKT